MKRNEEYVYKIYLKVFIFSTIFIGIQTIIYQKMYGEGVGVDLKLDNLSIALLIILQCVTLLLALPVFHYTKRCRLTIGYKKHLFTLNMKKLHVFVFFLLCVQIFFSIRTGANIVGHTTTESGSAVRSVLNMLKISAFMPIYYVVARERKKIYWVNVILWIAYQLVCGWTSIILQVAFIELFLQLKDKPQGPLVQLGYKLSGLATLVAILIGGFIYKYAWVIKNSIRYGFKMDAISYTEGIGKLLTRFTSFPLAIVSIQQHDIITQLYQSQNIKLVDIKSIFRTLLPSAIMGDKGFRTINNIIIQSMYRDISNNTSSNYCIWLFWRDLLSSSPMDFFVYIIVVFILLMVSKKIIYMFDNGNGNVDILYFMLIFQFFDGYSAETLFGYGYIGLIYLIPLMMLLGIIKLQSTEK